MLSVIKIELLLFIFIWAMSANINHILSEKNCTYWNSDVLHKFVEDFKINYEKKHVLYNQFLYTLGHGKNYIDKVRLLIKNFIYIWEIKDIVISDKECNNIWKSYVNNFSINERALIVKYIKETLEVNIKSNTSNHKTLEIDLREAHYKIDELNSKFNALMELYTDQCKINKDISEKYNTLEEEYHTLSSHYSEVYKMGAFRAERIEDLAELNNRLKNTVDELRTSRDLYRDLYTKLNL
jgi:hypothetical protein